MPLSLPLSDTIAASSLGLLVICAAGHSQDAGLTGDLKNSTTLRRYLPQAYLNYKRKSTIGWSVSNALTDMSGGLFSLAQQSLDAYALRVRASGCCCPGTRWP